jgi:hypothetical protein
MRHPGGLQKAIGMVLVFCAVLLIGCHQKPFVAQSRFLDTDTRVVLIDAWILDHAPPLFQAVVEYEGPDPIQKYDMRAILRSVDRHRTTGNLWNHPVPVAPGKNGKRRVIWEFVDFATETKLLSLEIYFTDKQTYTVQSLKFDLPPRSRLKTK